MLLNLSKHRKYFIIVIWLIIALCSSYNPTVIMPYKEISSSDVQKIGNSIQCSDPYTNIKTCAGECFKKSSHGQNCVGFLRDGNNCYLCKILNRTEINANSYTTIANNHILYLIKSPKIDPNVYISMEEINLNTSTITGQGVSGEMYGITADDIISGKKGQAIHFHGGRHIYPSVPQPECYCSFSYCNGTMSLSFWTRLYSTGYKEVIIPQKPIGLFVSVSGGSCTFILYIFYHVKLKRYYCRN